MRGIQSLEMDSNAVVTFRFAEEVVAGCMTRDPLNGNKKTG